VLVVVRHAFNFGFVFLSQYVSAAVRAMATRIFTTVFQNMAVLLEFRW
jgi:hypothetical protein